MRKITIIAVLAAFATPTFAIDDLPVYLDGGCSSGSSTGGLNNGYAQGPSDMVIGKKANGDKTVPVTCEDQFSGSDAIVVKLPRKLVNGEYWDFGIKFADDRAHSVKKFQDIRLWIKNKASTVAKFRLGIEAVNTSNPTMKNMEIPGGGDWKEYVVPLSEVGGDSGYGLKLSHPLGQYNGPDVDADPIDILIDSICITDGTGLHSLNMPAAIHNPRPANWGPDFLLGSFDNRELGKSTKAAQAGLPYRYQYMMPETRTYYSSSGKGYLYDYAMESDSLGVKTAIVWYNLGKVGEGWDPVTTNLASATYMNDYFDRYDWVLDQLAMAGQSDYMLIVEPDMYGFLMRGPGGATGTPVDDPTTIPVDMTKANSLSGNTYEPNLVGWAKYIVTRARQKLPKGVIIGHMPNHWGVSIPGQVGQGRKESHYISGNTIGTFLSAFGKEGLGDVVFVEKSDHDAGHKPTNENWFWDSTAYAKYFLWTRCIAAKTGLPICGWQVSEGNMSNVQKWKDDAAETFLAHPSWWIGGGFAGILFGAGNSDCANYLTDNDGGWFVNNMTTISQSPVKLPEPEISVKSRAVRTVNSLRMTSNSRGVSFSGFAGIAKAVFVDLSGRSLITIAIKPNQILSKSVLPSRLAFVRLSTAGGVQSFALMPVGIR
jgi:hypothetical protein